MISIVYKKIFSFLTVSLYLITSLFILDLPQAEARTTGIALTANSAYLLDAGRNQVLYSKRSNKKRPPASTVKVLTSLVAIEQLPLDRIVTVPKAAEAIEPSKIYIRAGERFKVRDLIKAVLLASANDAAYVLAVAAAGSQAKFARMMNARARKLGAKSSNFKTPNGLPAKGQYSTSHDLALIMKEASRSPILMDIMKKKTTVIYSQGGRKFTLRNHNKLLWRDPRDIIGKTGWTRRAKHCFVGHFQYGSKKLFFAIMGSASPWRDLKQLIGAFTINVQQFKNRKYHEKIWSLTQRKTIQKALRKTGYYKGEIDGKFGPQTQRAIRSFQKSKKLRVDGMVGPKTYRRLKAYL